MPSSDVLRFQTNVPETIALEYTDGLTVSSKFGGDQVMFSLCDGRKAFLPPFVAQKIADAGVQPKVPFVICKREVTNGNRRTVEYQIERAVNGKGPAATEPAPVKRAPESPASAPSSQTAAAAAPAAASPAAAAIDLMKTAAVGAIDVVLDAERYARSKGMTDFAFDPASIQDLVVSLFISMEKKAGRA